jgi:ATP-binding cassette, subfamily B, bacterial PglK
MLKDLAKLRFLFSRKDVIRYLILLGLLIIGALLEMVGVGAVPVLVAALAAPEQLMEYPVLARVIAGLGIESSRQLVLWGVATLMSVFLIKTIFLTFLSHTHFRTTEYQRVRLADRLFTAYMRAPYGFHLRRNSAELIRNVNNETIELLQGVLNPLISVTMGTLVTLAIVVLLLVSMPMAGLFGVLVVGGASWAYQRLFKNRMIVYGLEAQAERKAGLQAITQGLAGLLDARILQRETFFIEQVRTSIAKFARANRYRQFIGGASGAILEFIAVSGVLFIVLLLVSTGMNTVELIPVLGLFGAAVVRLRNSVYVIVSNISLIRFSIASIHPLVNDLQLLEGNQDSWRDHTQAVTSNVSRVPKTRLEHSLMLDGVTFTYPEVSAPALKDVSMIIERGRSVAFVGATGSGKTTLINVLLGLLKPQQGTIKIDGVDVFSNLSGWHANVGYIPQTIFLLDDSIKRNIAFGLPDDEIEDEKLWTAIRAAQLEDFINTLETGVDTTVGERGVRLSGGQRQRIGLARALYHNPEVLIMDEATSALDNQTENLVMQALEELKEGRTFIMIAHRLSTVRKCDRLYFLKNGSIEASGTYDELSRENMDFQRMAAPV